MEDLLGDQEEKARAELAMNIILMQQRIEQAKKEGRIVKTLDELSCDKHPHSKFIIGEQRIPGSHKIFVGKKGYEFKPGGLEIYFCGECGEDPVTQFPGVPNNSTMAYECSNCGIVKGNFKTVEYNDIDPNINLNEIKDLDSLIELSKGQPLAGRKGHHFHCNVCEFQIGYHYTTFS